MAQHPAGHTPGTARAGENAPPVSQKRTMWMRPVTSSAQTTRFRFCRWLITFIRVIIPHRFRTRFRQEWEEELEYREAMLARWDRLDWHTKFELLWRSLG